MVNIPKASIIGIFAMISWYGIRSKSYKISGDAAFIIGPIGILVTCFYKEIHLLITRCSYVQWALLLSTIFLGISLYLLIMKKSIFLKKEILFFQNSFNNHGWIDINGGGVIHYDDIAYSLNSSLEKISGSYSDGAEKKLDKKIGRDIVFSGYVYRPSRWSKEIPTDRLSIEDENNNGYGFCVYYNSNIANIEIIENGITVGCSEQKAFIAPKDQFYGFVLLLFKDGLIGLNIYNSYGAKMFSMSHKDKRFKNFDRIAVRGEAPFYIDELKIETI